MALLLALETTTTNCSVALWKDEKLIDLIEDRTPGYSHAELLHTFIQKVIEDNGFLLKSLDAVAISKGPGSYTGLRIGVSAAKGLCYALDVPLIAVDTLEALAMQYNKETHGEVDKIISCLDARRMEIYAGFYSVNSKSDTGLTTIKPVEALIIESDSFQDEKRQRLLFLGEATSKLSEKIESKDNFTFVEAQPSAKEVGILAMRKYKISDVEDVAYFEPFYLKDFKLG
ncbi:tRNA (adenosine(37)-N6)-threonylcarbamoyltransferase complex dimerization subunit type 1 TsaB [uncultured Mesonia sp.]|uniref:tRNA (adenosine(37)-N6)-threonylcarbamoyltransferase complex dimerization subunit type 1 TsaB n=1 Tax=uncultured Mesonia sp. TaxID=399731 RepID=UPI00374EA82B